MTIEEVRKYFKSGYRYNALTGGSGGSFLQWERKGYVPIKAQIKLEEFSNGALKASLDDLNKKGVVEG
jgi:hypothetical protein